MRKSYTHTHTYTKRLLVLRDQTSFALCRRFCFLSSCRVEETEMGKGDKQEKKKKWLLVTMSVDLLSLSPEAMKLSAGRWTVFVCEQAQRARTESIHL